MMRIAIVNDMPLAVAVLRRVVESVPSYRVAWVADRKSTRLNSSHRH